MPSLSPVMVIGAAVIVAVIPRGILVTVRRGARAVKLIVGRTYSKDLRESSQDLRENARSGRSHGS